MIYLHGNSSNRKEGLIAVENFILEDYIVCCFDFSACGLSDGEYISLGYREKDDLEAVVKYLKSLNKISSIGL